MFKIYPAIFHKENESYWVEFPDLPGCQSYGESLEEAILFAEEALGLYLVSLIESEEYIPSSSDISDIICSGEFTTYISTDIDKYRRNSKAVRKDGSIPAWLAEEAEKKHLSLSKILQEGLYKRLGL